jgi:hypothetical protein
LDSFYSVYLPRITGAQKHPSSQWRMHFPSIFERGSGCLLLMWSKSGKVGLGSFDIGFPCIFQNAIGLPDNERITKWQGCQRTSMIDYTSSAFLQGKYDNIIFE